MPDPWAKQSAGTGCRTASGTDLHLDIGAADGLRAGLVAALRRAVVTGRLAPGARLPSSRALAADLGISRNTVADAYGELVAEGRLTARTGAGTHVAHRAEHTGSAAPPQPAAIRTHVRPPVAPRHDLRSGNPDVSAFPRAACPRA